MCIRDRLFLAWEGLTGHPVPPRVQGVINTAGTVALVWLMILVTMHDISRFLLGELRCSVN